MHPHDIDDCGDRSVEHGAFIVWVVVERCVG